MVGKDTARPVFGTWFELVQKDLGSGGTLPGPNAVTLPVRTLIRTLAATEMSMMTGTITGHVLCRRMHSNTAQRTPGGRDSDSTEDEEPHSHQSPTEPMEVAREELDNQQAARNVEAHVFAPERESSHDSAERAVAASNPVASRAGLS
jgi:hypothetical protein